MKGEKVTVQVFTSLKISIVERRTAGRKTFSLAGDFDRGGG